jgi:hypothetical protein
MRGPAAGLQHRWCWRNLPGAVALRDSKDPDGPALVFTPDEWRAFAAGVRAGEVDSGWAALRLASCGPGPMIVPCVAGI